MSALFIDSLGEELTNLAVNFVNGPTNLIPPINPALDGEPEAVFATPLVGFAAADDPIFLDYKQEHIIGPYHWTPLEAFRLAFPDEQVEASELTVMSWVLPQTRATRKDQAKLKELTSERWVRSRIPGEKFVNVGLRNHMVNELQQRGIPAAAPQLLPQWHMLKDDSGHEYASTWSERHMAHAAGLGTFGVCDGLITPVGKAHRTGSIVIRKKIQPTPRPYTQHQEYCLYYSSGTCGACIKRCPVGALSDKGHDKALCYDYLWGVTHIYVRDKWDFDGYGCGLCQVAVPCESRIPPRKNK